MRSESLDRERTRTRRHRLRRAALLILVASALGLSTGPAPAQAHFDAFSDGRTFNCWIPYGGDCYWQPTNAVYHSYGFVSGNAGSSQYMCPSIWDGTRRYECGFGFERYCYYLWTHSSNDLDCHDRDGVSFLASVYYGGPYSAGASAYTTLHPTW